MHLTEIKIRSAKPKDAIYRISDGDGLYLTIPLSGKKRWTLRYVFGGIERTLSLGYYPEVSIREARDRRNMAKKQLETNIDPCVNKRREKANAAFRNKNSFYLIAEEWFGARKPEWCKRHADKIWHRLEKYVFPDLGRIPIADIQPLEVLRVIQKIEASGAIELGGRQLAICSRVFKYAIVTGRLRYNPAADLTGELRRYKVTHRPYLRDVELPHFLEALSKFKRDEVHKIGTMLLLLTALRPGELRRSRWADVKMDILEWHLRPEIMKMKEPHLVPLSRQAVGLLSQLHQLTGSGEWLFPGRPGQKHPIVHENFVANVIEDAGFKGRVVAHGFRATFSTILNQAGFNRDAIERQLAHRESNRIRSAYNHAEYLHERRAMMQWWADYLDDAARPSMHPEFVPAGLDQAPLNVFPVFGQPEVYSLTQPAIISPPKSLWVCESRRAHLVLVR